MPEEIPSDEMRDKKLNLFASVQVTASLSQAVLDQVECVMNYSNNLTKVHRIMARVMRGWGNTKIEKKITNSRALTYVAAEPTGQEIEKAKQVLLVHAMVS